MIDEKHIYGYICGASLIFGLIFGFIAITTETPGESQNMYIGTVICVIVAIFFFFTYRSTDKKQGQLNISKLDDK